MATAAELDRQLHDFMRAHRQGMQKFFSGCGMFNGHPFMLFIIRKTPGITPAQLAKQMDLTPATVTICLKRMEAAGLLRRQADERDRRVWHLVLTPEGEAMDDLCRKGQQFMADTLFSDFSPDELAVLSGMISRMQQNLASADAGRWLSLHREREEDTL